MAVGGFLAGGFVAARYEARLGQVRREAFAFREGLRQEEATLRERAAAYQRLVELLRDPATRVTTLRGAGPAATAHGRVVWHQAAGGHVVVAGLPPAPAGQAYALWGIRAGRPRAAAVIPVDARGQGSQPLGPLGAVEAFVVTLEPAASGPVPLGPVVLSTR
jgi:hypothetical protein